jgi:queuine/archaeosine tRNA-ribosyltransferase
MGEPLAARLATLHNLEYFVGLFREIRRRLEDGSFQAFAVDFLLNPKNIYLGGEASFQNFPQEYR